MQIHISELLFYITVGAMLILSFLIMFVLPIVFILMKPKTCQITNKKED